jgi:hypothetical protein
LLLRDAETGATSELGRILPGQSPFQPLVLSAGIAEGVGYVVQMSWLASGTTEVRHLLRFRAGMPADTLLVGAAGAFNSLVVAPDGRSLVYADGGDLFRLELP